MSISVYDKLIVKTRTKSNAERSLSEEFTSDKSRIIFSSPFRRLQQKAQVFSLETNAAVRSRLTHTLEVATIGISIAEKIVHTLVNEKLIAPNLVLPFIKIVENACLIHDIGNPPFGHFAETAIKEWFAKNWRALFFKATKLEKSKVHEYVISKTLMQDFLHFDGNPQGVRIVCKLQDIPGLYTDIGLNLTYSQIASIIKYPGSTSNVNSKNPLYKKAGYFHSENAKIEEIKQILGFENRYPLTYIMEAADDISYCLSDIEDGLEKRILSTSYFFQKLQLEWTNNFDGKTHDFDSYFTGKTKADFFKFKIELTRELEQHAINTYIGRHKEVLNGTLPELIDKDTDGGLMLKCLKAVARKYLFRSPDAENNELAGHEIILGILNKYSAILKIKHGEFYNLVSAKEDLDKVLGSGLDLEWRLFNRLPEKYIEAYKFEYGKCKTEFDEETFIQYEWFHRAHLIVDYISGMTDNYALETYKLLYGIKL